MIHALLGLCVFFLFCLAFYFLGGAEAGSIWGIVQMTAKAAALPTLLYVLNYSLLVPRLFFNDRKVWFFLADTLLIIVVIFLPVIYMELPEDVDMEKLSEQFNGLSIMKILAGSIILRLVLYLCMIALAIGMRYAVRWYEERKKLEEERRRNAEAELNWLKNQLNPHFLFNTLNNISSLVQIDADKAQDSIAQLSDLLRYALYGSNNAKVRIVDEVEFMRNYIALMSLRCNGKTTVDVKFDDFDTSLMISPLLFISLVENAFKHGTSAHNESYVKVDMGLDGDDVVFSCENTAVIKDTIDYSGSGVGLENMKRRLELIYPGSYSYENFVEDGRYVAVVRIRNVKGHE